MPLDLAAMHPDTFILVYPGMLMPELNYFFNK
jgi:hypothetical protein